VPLTPATKRRNRRRSKGVSLHGGGMTMSIIELMHQIVNEPSPRLPAGKFGGDVEEFVDGCLEKDIEKRRTPKELFVSFSFSLCCTLSLSPRVILCCCSFTLLSSPFLSRSFFFRFVN
jgi:hypothetical protein